MYKGILLDLGDTVFYNENMSYAKGAEYLYEMIDGPKPNFEQFINIFLQITNECYANRFIIEVPFINILKYLETFLDISYKLSYDKIEIGFAMSFSKNTLVSHIISFLHVAKEKNIPIVALSNSAFSSSTLINQLENLHIRQYFTAVLSSADYGFRKPSSYFFNIGIKKLKLPKEEIAFIGNDYEIDIVGSLKVGLDVFWFNENNLPNPKQVNSFNSFLTLNKIFFDV